MLSTVTNGAIDQQNMTPLNNINSTSINSINTPNTLSNQNKRTAEGTISSLSKRKYGRQISDWRFHYREGNGEEGWVTIEDIKITNADKKDISAGNCLNDQIINAAMKLVANECPLFDGLKFAVMIANGLCDSPITGEGLQIHHVGFHWLISSSIGNHLRVYDSLNTTLTPGMRHQMAALYSPFATGIYGNLEITVICSQRQLGSYDCGLFAIQICSLLP